MYKRRLQLPVFILITFLVAMLSACDSFGPKTQKPFVLYEITDNGRTLLINSDTLNTYSYKLYACNVLLDSGHYTQAIRFDIEDELRKDKIKIRAIALAASKNHNIIDVKLAIQDSIDTIYHYHLNRHHRNEYRVSIRGIGARIYPKAENTNIDSELKKWLYRRNEHLNDSTYRVFRVLFNELDYSGSDDYTHITNDIIPVVHNLKDIKFNVACEIKSDYYALVACSQQAYIDQYMEFLVSKDFEGLYTSLSSPLLCHHKTDGNGFKCIFLLCINKDWSYQQIPLALVAFDNKAPFVIASTERRMPYYGPTNPDIEPSTLDFKDGTRILLPKNKPLIYGTARVDVPNWDGNRLECNVTFNIEFSGDVKSVTIQRRGVLCDYDKYLGYHLKPEDKVISSKTHGRSYTFVYKLHLEDGDNMIPVIVEDFHGNKKNYNHMIKARFVRSNAPSINIDNNIDVHN